MTKNQRLIQLFQCSNASVNPGKLKRPVPLKLFTLRPTFDAPCPMWPHLGQLTGQGEFTASFPPPALPRQPRDARRRPPFVAALSLYHCLRRLRCGARLVPQRGAPCEVYPTFRPRPAASLLGTMPWPESGPSRSSFASVTRCRPCYRAPSLLRRQLNILRRISPKRLVPGKVDRVVFCGLCRLSPTVLNALNVLQPDTVICWHRTGLRAYSRRRSRQPGGRPRIPRFAPTYAPRKSPWGNGG